MSTEVRLQLSPRLTPHLRLDTETGEVVARIDEGVLRQIVREEMDAAITRFHQQGLDHLLTDIDGEPEPQDEIVAVLAELTEQDWETLVQRVRERKSHEQ